MNEKVKISVIIPVYNVEKYLDKMLASVFNQTINNLQVIIVNDGSTDNSETIIEKYIDMQPDIIYLKQENKGVSAARNIALDKIKGKYTIFLDPDDYIDSNILLKLYNKAEESSSDVVICGYKMIYEKSLEQINCLYEIEENKIYKNIEIVNMILENKLICFLWNKLFLTKNLFRNKLYFELDRYSQDWMPVFKQINYSNRITFINEPLYNYTIRENSNSHNKSFKRINDHTFAIKSIIDYINKNNVRVNKGRLHTFIMMHEIMNIRMCGKELLNKNKEVYLKCKIEKMNLLYIILNMGIPLKLKCKYVLLRMKKLHKYIKES